MDELSTELKILLAFSRHLPPVPRITGINNRILKKFYLRKTRTSVVADVFDFRMELDPNECVDANILFHPHLHDREEINFLKRELQAGDTFLDIGSNIGFYSLVVSPLVGPSGCVLAIEADPAIYRILTGNIDMNSIRNIRPLNVGVSDKEEELSFGLCTVGNRGGNSFLRPGDKQIRIRCRPLLDILVSENVTSVKAIKIDIEGFEYKVLNQFFADAPVSLHPRVVIIENIERMNQEAGGDSIGLLKELGYRVVKKIYDNYVMVKE